jgi:hypothetical protein
MVVGLNEGERGVGGEVVRDTCPVKPPVGVTVMVELFEAPPATRVRKCWLAPKTMAWPVTVTWMSAEWNRKPLLEKRDPSIETV